jgi:hypothetical protein
MTCCSFLPRDFTQTDPFPMGPGSAFEQSYAYGTNNPARFVDPTGLRSSGAAMSSPSPKQIPDSCVFSTYNWSYCLHGQFQSRSAIDPTDLTNVKYVGAFLDAYGFSGGTEGSVDRYEATFFHPEGIGNYAVRTGVLTVVHTVVNAMFSSAVSRNGDPSNGSSFGGGLKGVQVGFLLELKPAITYIHRQAQNQRVLVPPRLGRGELVAFDGEKEFSRLVWKKKWVKSSDWNIEASYGI